MTDEEVISLIRNGRSFMHIHLYNNRHNLQIATDILYQRYDSMGNFQGLLAGVLGWFLFSPDAEKRVVFGMALSFLFSLYSALIAKLAEQYFQGIRDESNEFIILGSLKFHSFFYTADMAGIASFFCLAVGEPLRL